ncbi:MAG: GNAT family N-acetyltransferase [Terrimonas sp.]|nr:GNAT family N-acetyltransferase [Terrimonas sp.]
MEYKFIDKVSGVDTQFTNETIADFLFLHLDQFGDKKDYILKCLDFVFAPDHGGFVLVSYENGDITGAVIVNETGMEYYIPENILVYIAVHRDQRGKGLGKTLLQKTMERAKGSIALHVEPDNPAKKLYEKLGFTNKYLEMRLQR